MTAVTRPESERSPWCSLCYESFGDDDPAQTLSHIQREHFDAEEFQQFIREVVVWNLCAKCGKGFWSDVRALNEWAFGARPYCIECRRENRALKDLTVDLMDARELASRGLIRPEYARKSRELLTESSR